MLSMYFFADETLQSPPPGFDSVLGVKQSMAAPSFFVENEYVVFDAEQVRIKYLVEFVEGKEKQWLPRLVDEPKKMNVTPIFSQLCDRYPKILM